MFTTKVGSVYQQEDREEAARLVAQGEVVGIFNRGVCALWFDGGSREAIKKLKRIKGDQRGDKAIALTLSLDEFITMIDLSKLPPKVRKFLSSDDLKGKIGSLCFIRAPLKDTYHSLVPSQSKTFNKEGVCMIQNWDSHGHSQTEDFLKKLNSLGVKHPGVSSMNESDKAEIVDQIEAEKFCQDKEIPLFLKDVKAHPEHKGSYTIISLDQDGIRLQREGNIPSWIIEQILEVKLIRDNTKKSKHPQLNFPRSFGNLPPDQIREKVLQYLRYD